ncbi:MAG: hypothetical protein R3C10_18810 [Pirellulales bacterium]
MPAGEIERFVVDQIAHWSRAPAIVKETLAQARRLTEEQTERLELDREDVRERLRQITSNWADWPPSRDQATRGLPTSMIGFETPSGGLRQ